MATKLLGQVVMKLFGQVVMKLFGPNYIIHRNVRYFFLA